MTDLHAFDRTAPAVAVACTSLVTCLPALEQVKLALSGPMPPGGLGRLLEALACRPCLQ